MIMSKESKSVNENIKVTILPTPNKMSLFNSVTINIS